MKKSEENNINAIFDRRMSVWGELKKYNIDRECTRGSEINEIGYWLKV